ncbi:hypothetical protein QE152_g318 [Popillia japonica]|uniref:Uncharacterized protein n=1 Tax=Popillia japonica TaxID=7064 RepID=A0AAW1NC21_POPJA
MYRERKREREEERAATSTDKTTNIFQVSKKVLRSPEQKKIEGKTEEPRTTTRENRENVQEVDNMDEVKDVVKQILHEMAKNSAELKEEIRHLKEEIIDIKREMITKEEKWNEEKQILLQRIETMENKVENQEKQNRRNNVIIKGIDTRDNTNHDIEMFLEQKLHIKPKIERATLLNQDKEYQIIRVETATFEDKQDIMKEKSKLKNTKIYIDNDMTPNKQQHLKTNKI